MGLKFLSGIPHTKSGAQLNLTEEAKFMCRVVYKPSDEDPEIYKPYALWNPETEYPEGCVAIPIQSTYGGLTTEYPAGTKFVNVEGSSTPRDPVPPNEKESWIGLIEEKYAEEAAKPNGVDYDASTCCAEEYIYRPNIYPEQKINGFSCSKKVDKDGNTKYTMIGGHVLMNQSNSSSVKPGETVQLLPICHRHNVSKMGNGKTGAGYYMKLRRPMKALILNNYKNKELSPYLNNEGTNNALTVDSAEKIVGIDISYCQDGLSFDEVEKAGVKFVIIRAGISESSDTHLFTFAAECERRGIPYGFYWYSLAQDVDGAKREAEKCLEVIKQYSPSYPVYFDMEDGSQKKLDKQTCTEMAEAFCEAIKGAGYTAGIYGSPGWFEAFYNYKELFDKYEVWMAHWTEDPNKPSRFNYGQKIWQWGTTKIGGIKVDGNIAFFDYSKK